MTKDRCIWIEGALVRVTGDFDESPDSEDMKQMTALIQAMNKIPEVIEGENRE